MQILLNSGVENIADHGNGLRNVYSLQKVWKEARKEERRDKEKNKKGKVNVASIHTLQ